MGYILNYLRTYRTFAWINLTPFDFVFNFHLYFNKLYKYKDVSPKHVAFLFCINFWYSFKMRVVTILFNTRLCYLKTSYYFWYCGCEYSSIHANLSVTDILLRIFSLQVLSMTQSKFQNVRKERKIPKTMVGIIPFLNCVLIIVHAPPR